MFECAVPADAKVPIPHSHDAFEETIYGLEGVCIWTIDGQARELGPAESVCIRRGQVHGFENRGTVDAEFLAIATPARSDPATSGTSPRSSPPLRAARPIWPRSAKRCAATG